jgi:hypothetical protein
MTVYLFSSQPFLGKPAQQAAEEIQEHLFVFTRQGGGEGLE